MTKILPCENLSSYKAGYLAQRFGITVDEARALKRGEPVEIANVKAEKMLEQGFARLAAPEQETVSETAIESEAEHGDQ